MLLVVLLVQTMVVLLFTLIVKAIFTLEQHKDTLVVLLVTMLSKCSTKQMIVIYILTQVHMLKIVIH